MVVYQCLSVNFYLIVILRFVSEHIPGPYSHEAGVPQGSILSVTLFSLKINSNVSCLLPDIKCSLYVDDTAIYYSSSHMPYIERMILSFYQLKLCVSIFVNTENNI